jgi:hypothetical protein
MSRATRNSISNETRNQCTGEVLDLLRETLGVLLPSCRDIARETEEHVRKAIALKDFMSEEQTLFSSFVAKEVDEEYVNLEGQCDVDKIMCTFPGFGRFFKDDDNIPQFICVVRARAEGWRTRTSSGIE